MAAIRSPTGNERTLLRTSSNRRKWPTADVRLEIPFPLIFKYGYRSPVPTNPSGAFSVPIEIGTGGLHIFT